VVCRLDSFSIGWGPGECAREHGNKYFFHRRRKISLLVGLLLAFQEGFIACSRSVGLD
jgi:hypothetical protein